MQTLAIHTLGCKLNFSESSSIGRQLSSDGYTLLEFDQKADVYILNTCSVTENADKKCRQTVKAIQKRNPHAYVVIIGCYAQLKPKEISEIPGVSMVLGAKEKFNLSAHLKQLQMAQDTLVFDGAIKEVNEFVPSYSFGDRTRSFLKVQDGCDYFCSFCTIPLARGSSRSASVQETVEKARELAESGVKEVVITGVNIGDFGQGTEETFLHLIKELDEIEGIERFRISSIEPNLLDDDIIRFVAKSKKFVPHFHIPLQSGSNRILKSMRRKYKRELYAERVQRIKSLMPSACIGVDIIVGFPGETELEFRETYSFLKNLDISYLHVFPYSERDNTTARKLPGKVRPSDKMLRAKMLRILSEKKKRAFYESQQGLEHEVLIESEADREGMMFGFSENYVRFRVPAKRNLANTLQHLKFEKFSPDGYAEMNGNPEYRL